MMDISLTTAYRALKLRLSRKIHSMLFLLISVLLFFSHFFFIPLTETKQREKIKSFSSEYKYDVNTNNGISFSNNSI